ncbi:MAG: hypothetical protein IJU83_00535 [Clostridia bacterium]|nr:hypothetical protein [Clostridia bacterium]
MVVLKNKPTYVLRDLARKMGVAAPTDCPKNKLIELIYQRKEEIEKGEKPPVVSKKGRPYLENSYIDFKRGANGEIVFVDTVPQTDVAVFPVVKEPKDRKRLKEIRDMLVKITAAIDYLL